MGYAYVQVAMTITADRSTEEREYRPFEQIRDNQGGGLLMRILVRPRLPDGDCVSSLVPAM